MALRSINGIWALYAATMTRCALPVVINDAPRVPMQIGIPATGDFRRYEVDVLEELARRLGMALHYRRAYQVMFLFSII